MASKVANGEVTKGKGGAFPAKWEAKDSDYGSWRWKGGSNSWETTGWQRLSGKQGGKASQINSGNHCFTKQVEGRTNLR